jgi:hypothetical protein
MTLFKRRRAAAPPDWAGFLDPGQWAEFSALVREHVAARRWIDDIEQGYVMQPFPEVLIALGDLARACHRAPRPQWPRLIAARLDRAVAMDAAIENDPDAARAVLRARLVDDAFLDDLGWELASRPVAAGLHLVLAHDLPTMVTMPARADVLRLGGEDELFELALEQTRMEEAPEPDRYDLRNPDGSMTPLWLVTGESFFTATHALWAEEIVPPASPHGTLVAIPDRHTLLVHPIRDLRVIRAVNHLLALAGRMHAAGPGSISDSIYWLRDGSLERLQSHTADEQVRFAPPQSFVQVLERLT